MAKIEQQQFPNTASYRNNQNFSPGFEDPGDEQEIIYPTVIPVNRTFSVYVVLLLVMGVAIGYASTYFAGASVGLFDAKVINSGDTAWVLTASALVLLMTPAVGWFYAGMVTSKNAGIFACPSSPSACRSLKIVCLKLATASASR